MPINDITEERPIAVTLTPYEMVNLISFCQAVLTMYPLGGPGAEIKRVTDKINQQMTSQLTVDDIEKLSMIREVNTLLGIHPDKSNI
jgi:hypothetical protein